MLNLILIITLVGVIFLSAGFAAVTFLQGIQSSLDTQITTQRLQDVAAQIRSHVRAIDPGTGNTVSVIPVGTLGSSPYAYNQVPSFMDIASLARSASGVPFHYCPYLFQSATYNNNSFGTSGTITMPSGSTYAMRYTSNASTISQSYVTDVTGTTPPTTANANMMGLLVAAGPNQYYPPNCSSVTTDSSGAYTIVSGGIVAVISNDDLNDMRVPAAQTDMKLYVSTAQSGDGSGRDTSNYITLSDALTIISSLIPSNITLYIDATGSPTYNLTTVNGTTFNYGNRIHLVGINGSGATLNTSTSITIDEYSLLSIGNLTFNLNSGAGTLLVNGALEMAENSPTLTLGTLQIYGGTLKGYTTTMTVNGNVTVDGGGLITSSGPMVFNNLGNRGFNLLNGAVYGGTTMVFNPNANSTVPIIIGAGGDMVTGTGNMTINAAGTYTLKGGMIIRPGGRFIAGTNSADAGSDYYNSGSDFTTSSKQVIVNKLGGFVGTDFGFYVHGEMDIVAGAGTGAIISYTNLPSSNAVEYGIILASGGKLQIFATSGVTLGSSSSRPVTGIYDVGGSYFYSMGTTGTNIIYASTTGACWSSNTTAVNLFSESTAGTSNGVFVAQTSTAFPQRYVSFYSYANNFQCQRT